MGAEIAKIETPGAGDTMRQWGQGPQPVSWRVIARNKYSVALDLRGKEGQELARRLIGAADILIENFRPGTLEKWGLDPKILCEENPRLIVVRVSGYGQDGPYAQRAGFGGIAEAMGGWRGIVGYPDRPPVRMGVSIGDSLAATYGCMGALAALHRRSVTGRGQIIDVTLYESVLQVMEGMLPEFQIAGHKRTRTGSTIPQVAPSNVYPCRDGELMIGANNDAIFERFCKIMGRADMLDDPRYKTLQARGLNMEALDAEIAAWTAQHSVAELEALMLEAAVPAGRLYDAEDMLRDPHFAARKAIISVDDPVLGPTTMQGVFPKFSETPGGVRRAAPREVGQDTADVLERWLGV
jgi:formyl-CoA transferase